MLVPLSKNTPVLYLRSDIHTEPEPEEHLMTSLQPSRTFFIRTSGRHTADGDMSDLSSEQETDDVNEGGRVVSSRVVAARVIL